ncbi:hypothetical protein [Polaromonas sp.]|uniref:hypothetical protein n=1 Tax=Polaromonas sp. TaxID=1869339 RepID=UPI003BB558AE
MKTLLIALIVATVLAGCASSGVQVSQAAATQFREGVSTEADVVAKLGKPNMVTISGNVRTIAYNGIQYETKAATFIPIVGLFAGGSDTSITTASYEIGQDGIVKKISYATSGSNTRMGATPAEMAAREPTAVK